MDTLKKENEVVKTAKQIVVQAAKLSNTEKAKTPKQIEKEEAAHLKRVNKLQKSIDSVKPEAIEYMRKKLEEEINNRLQAKKNKLSTPLAYSVYVFKSDIYAVSETSEGSGDVNMYQWVGNHWKFIEPAAGRRLAFSWLESNSAFEACDRLAGECFRTSLLKAKPLPPKTKKVIIPVKNKWVHVTNDGQMTLEEPDSNIGITYEIKAELKLQGNCKDYQPAPLPEDSRLNKFLSTSIPNVEIRNLIQEYFGYTFIPDTRYQVCLIIEGEAGTGKSVLAKILSACHARTIDIRLDAMKKFGLANLPNASLVVCSEAPKGGIDEEEFKKVITGDKVTIEAKNKNEYQCSPTAKWLILCNSFPRISDATRGVWRRLMTIPWKADIKQEELVRNLDEIIIEEELNLFIDWCLEGLQRLMKRGDFDIPKEVLHVGNERRLANDTVHQFCDSYNVVETGDKCLMSRLKLYECYVKFAEGEYLTPVGPSEFGKRIKSQFPGYKIHRKTQAPRTYMVNLEMRPFESEVEA